MINETLYKLDHLERIKEAVVIIGNYHTFSDSLESELLYAICELIENNSQSAYSRIRLMFQKEENT